jgi:hypothetical protein
LVRRASAAGTAPDRAGVSGKARRTRFGPDLGTPAAEIDTAFARFVVAVVKAP